MKRGALAAGALTLILSTACSSDGKLEIRALQGPVSATSMPVPERIAEAQAQLALGNVALALESYRKASREDPGSVQALLGMATCYDMMRRFDLSRRNYEAALALAPASPEILNRFASSLDQQGAAIEAAEVRQEIALRAARPAPTTAIASAVTLPLPPATARPNVKVSSSAAPSVSLVLPPAEPLQKRTGPKLERLSFGEVALRTSGGPKWSTPAEVANRANVATARRSAGPSIRLLNAARHQGLAARTRHFLAERGWRRMAIGDAPSVRQTSIVYYPAERRATAQRLAAQFNFPLAPRNSGTDIIMLLGRDAAGRATGSP